MGHDVTIRLDDATVASYRQAADEHGRSLEDELLAAISESRPRARLGREALLALSRRLRADTPAVAAAVDSTLLIREDRDRR